MAQKYKLEIGDLIYEIDKRLPPTEMYNLSSQIKRAATSISLNIAEGSTNSSSKEFVKYLRIAVRSYLEVYACYILIKRRKYIEENDDLCLRIEGLGSKLFAKLQALIKAITI